MAGNYPDAPSWRMALDRDGSVGVFVNPVGTLTQLTGTQMQALNDESANEFAFSGGSIGAGVCYFAYVFPEARDIDAYMMNIWRNAWNTNVQVEVSADTTNGQDGTWVAVGAPLLAASIPVSGEFSKPKYRTAISSATQFAKRGIRIKSYIEFGSNNAADALRIRDFHIYGEPAPGANPHRLELWHPTLDEKLPPAWFDWGDTPRSSSADRLFRVKNLSPTLTAGDTRVAMDVLTDASPSLPGQHTLSVGGGSFLAQVNVGSLAPGAISPVVTLRRITPSNAQLGLWSMRVFAESTSWS